MMNNNITVETAVKAPLSFIWNCFTQPTHITQWYRASDDWHTPFAENDLNTNGRFKFSMAAKDQSQGFDFTGTYTNIKEFSLIAFTIDDGRKVSIHFKARGNEVLITEYFEAESTNPKELQKNGWQAILNNFKIYTESKLAN